jgi:hypothetical protein
MENTTTETQYEEHFYINELKENPDTAWQIFKDDLIKLTFIISFL